MKIIKFYLGILCVIPLISCQTESDVISSPEDNLNLLKEFAQISKSLKPDGSIVLQSNAFGTGENAFKTVTISQKADDDNLKLRSINSEVISFKNHESNSKLSKLYGNNINLDFLNNGNKSHTDSLYIPEELIVNFSSDEIKVGDIINWNVDSKNTKGLLILISYDPIIQQDFDVSWNNQYKIEEVFALPESNGSYIIKSEDVERFPENASLNIKISRGAYLPSSGSNPAFIAFTKVSNDLKVKKGN